jgi:hypothetical protein
MYVDLPHYCTALNNSEEMFVGHARRLASLSYTPKPHHCDKEHATAVTVLAHLFGIVCCHVLEDKLYDDWQTGNLHRLEPLQGHVCHLDLWPTMPSINQQYFTTNFLRYLYNISERNSQKN